MDIKPLRRCLPLRRYFPPALILASAWVLGAPGPALGANPTIQGVPNNSWHYTNGSPPIRFKVKNTSPRGQGPRRIHSIHIITNAPGSVPMRPLDIYRTTEDARTSAQSPSCAPRGANGLACDGLDAGPGDTLTVDFTTSPSPYPHSATITVIADSKVEGQEILGDPITLNGPGPPPPNPPTPSPYPPPPPIGSPPPSDAMSKSSKKGVILFAKGTQTVGGAIGLYGAYVAFSTGPAPEPVTKGTGAGLLLIGAAVGFVGLATEFVAELVDPFDPAFKRVARAVPVNAPRIGAGAGIPKAVARAINRLAMNAARVDAYGDALLTAYNRAASATKRDDLAARSRQLRAAARFARSLAKFLDADPALRRRLSQAIRAAHLSLGVNPGRLPQIRRSLRRGPPPFLRSVLRTFGLNKAEIRDFTRQIANVKLGSPLPRVTSLLANKRIAAAEHRAANGFREVARAFDAAA